MFVYMYVCVCMCVCMYVCMYVCIYVCMHVFVSICQFVRPHEPLGLHRSEFCDRLQWRFFFYYNLSTYFHFSQRPTKYQAV